MGGLGTARSALDTLVGFDTTSSTSNAEAVAWLANRLDRPGVTIWDLPEPMRPSGSEEDVEQHNLLVRIGADRPGARVLSAHTDCVPVTGQPWTGDPFAVREQDGRLVGRGTCDMKGFIAACLAVLDDVNPDDLAVPIVLALSHSEEVGTLGAPSLVAALLEHIDAPQLAIVGEPTMMEVIGAHKGVRGAWVTVDGVDGHSSQPHRAASASVAAARLIAHIDDVASRHEVDGPHDTRFVPPMTTFNVGMVRGGEAINIVPRQTRFHFEYRPIPGVDPDAVLDEVRAHARDVILPTLARHVDVAEVGIHVTLDAKVLALDLEDGGAAEALARECGAVGEGAATVAYGTDGGWLQQAGLSVVVCGPGSIDQAHRPDEFLAIDQLDKSVTFLDRLVSSSPAAR